MPRYLGSKTLNNQTLKDTLQVDGALTFSHLKIPDAVEVKGAASGIDLQCYELTVRGSLTQSRQIKAHKAHIYGFCRAHDLKIQDSLQIEGSAQGSHWTISGPTRVVGFLSVIDSEFNTIHMSGNHNRLMHCKANHLTLVKDPYSGVSIKGIPLAPYESNILKLLDTTIEGDIIFQGEKGVVYMDETSVIKGKVINGTVIKDAEKAHLHSSFQPLTLSLNIPPILIFTLVTASIASVALAAPFLLSFSLIALLGIVAMAKLPTLYTFFKSPIESRRPLLRSESEPPPPPLLTPSPPLSPPSSDPVIPTEAPTPNLPESGKDIPKIF